MICLFKRERFDGMKKRHPERKFYYIEHYTAVVSEPIELYTWEDACEVVDNSRLLHPEKELVIREFEF